MTKKGTYISIDGMDGVGKTTMTKRIADSFKSEDVFVFGALTTNPVSKSIRDIITNPDSVLLPKTETLLLVAAHWENYYSTITNLLSEGKTVIADRSAMSALAYQGYAYSEITGDTSNITLIEPLLNKLMADYQFIITGNPYQSLTRCQVRDGKKDRIESREIEYHIAVNNFFTVQANDKEATNRYHIHNDGDEVKFNALCSRAIWWLRFLSVN